MGSVEQHMDQACSCLRMGKMREAIKEYKAALKGDPKNAIAHKSLGGLYYRQTMLEEAIAEYKKAIKLFPKYSDAHYELGIALYRRGKLEEAVDSFT